MITKPLILITNDDSIHAPGLRKLITSVEGLGRILVMAPNKPQSGQGHALTVEEPLRIYLQRSDDDYTEYACSGTPADCIKMATQQILERKPDLILSGVNHGANTSVNAIYSGTIAAVIEGCMMGIPAIGFSLNDNGWKADLSHIGDYIRQITENVIADGLPDYVCLNVNFPAKNAEPIRGIRVCHQGLGEWSEDFEKRIDPQGRDYYWIKGVYKYNDPRPDTDIIAIRENYVSIVPTMFDWTAKNMVEPFKKRFQNV
ncbi:MAG: 5'/3'-nucleotidase SurE [Bacteroidales bacterium]|nr:5'/3'-nucleotidase SurE [Bacteroidales bacterium]